MEDPIHVRVGETVALHFLLTRQEMEELPGLLYDDEVLEVKAQIPSKNSSSGSKKVALTVIFTAKAPGESKVSLVTEGPEDESFLKEILWKPELGAEVIVSQ